MKAGRKLGDLHCGYESVKPWKDCVVNVANVKMLPNANTNTNTNANCKLETGTGNTGNIGNISDSLYHITKMRFAKKENPVDANKNGKIDRAELEDRSRIIYNDRVTIRGIPLAAYDYQVNGKSAIEWVMDRYQVTTNKDSGIVNDPNKWLEESGDERYIVDLILKVVTVSMETEKIVSTLPKLEF